jgi:hypothetical protein
MKDKIWPSTAETQSSLRDVPSSCSAGTPSSFQILPKPKISLLPYAYKPLLYRISPDRLFDYFTIRVLVLEPAPHRGVPLCGHFENVELGTNNRASYEPVSYVWGDSTLNHVLLCEKQELLITASADTVLRRFRLADKPRRLWIDAICRCNGSVT